MHAILLNIPFLEPMAACFNGRCSQGICVDLDLCGQFHVALNPECFLSVFLNRRFIGFLIYPRRAKVSHCRKSV